MKDYKQENRILRLALLLIMAIAATRLLTTYTDDTNDTDVPTVAPAPVGATFVWTQPQPIRCLQKALSDAGYYKGRIDGRYGQMTAEAHRKWDRDNAGLVEIEWQDN